MKKREFAGSDLRQRFLEGFIMSLIEDGKLDLAEVVMLREFEATLLLYFII